MCLVTEVDSGRILATIGLYFEFYGEVVLRYKIIVLKMRYTEHKDVAKRLTRKQRPAPKRMFLVQFVSAIP
mgnify:CR=1 FL=1